MALVLADRVLETTTTTGSGTITLAGAATGYQSFAAVGNANTTYYTITDGTNWEVGIGTYTASGTTLSRDTVLSSSNSGQKVTFPAGTKNVFVDYPAGRAVYGSETGTVTISSLAATSAVITNLNSTSANITTLTGTSAGITTLSSGSANITQLQSTSATITTLTGTSANITTLTGSSMNVTTATHASANITQLNSTSATISTLTSTSATITNLTATSIVISNLSIASANITTLTSTNATAASLTVSTGNLTFSSTAQRITGDVSNATVANRLLFQNSVTNGSTNFQVIPNGTGTVGGYIAFNSSDPANASFLALQVIGTSDVRLNSSLIGTGTYLPMTFNTGGSERMRLDTSGNVGIGTASPAQKLDVQGSGNVSGRVTSSSNTGISSFYAVNSSGSLCGSVIYGSSATPYGSVGANESAFYSTVPITIMSDNASGVIKFATGASSGTERMRIDSSGNVGIGTASPSQKLDVAGAVAASNFYTPDTAGTLGTSTTSVVAFGSTGSVGLTNVLQFNTNSAERMRIDSSGNVGIGTTSPGAKLDVQGGRSYFAANSDAFATYLQYNNSTAGVFVGSPSADAFQISKSSGAAYLNIDSSGNVGIGGTASAYARTAVMGNLPVSSGTSISYDTQAVITSGATSVAVMYESFPSIQNASFTLPTLYHFAAAQGTKGASATVTTQFGFHAGSTLTGATNNFGFYSDIASGTNRWNFYANGTAQNYFAGNTGIGGANDGTYGKLGVLGTGYQALFAESTDASGAVGYVAANAATDVRVGSLSNHPVKFFTNSVEAAQVDVNKNFVINTAAIATNATNGFLYVPSCAGQPTGTPTTYTGRVPIVVDTTNNKLYFYSTGAWRDAGP